MRVPAKVPSNYASACSCLGITRSTTTIQTPTAMRTTSTTTTLATPSTSVTSTVSQTTTVTTSTVVSTLTSELTTTFTSKTISTTTSLTTSTATFGVQNGDFSATSGPLGYADPGKLRVPYWDFVYSSFASPKDGINWDLQTGPAPQQTYARVQFLSINGNYLLIRQTFNVKPSTVYRFSFDSRITPGVNCHASFYFNRVHGGSYLGYANLSPPNTFTWFSSSTSYTTDASTTTVELEIFLDDCNTYPAEVDLTNISLKSTST